MRAAQNAAVAGRVQTAAASCEYFTWAKRRIGQNGRRWAAISIRNSIATGRGTPTLPSSHRLTADRLTPIAPA